MTTHMNGDSEASGSSKLLHTKSRVIVSMDTHDILPPDFYVSVSEQDLANSPILCVDTMGFH